MSPCFRALVVDDERLARRELRSMLDRENNIEVVGEAWDVPSAAEAVRALMPDVVFLDIQMHGESGFELLDKMDIDVAVIFTTAFDEYAVRAFEVNALDYLMKPIDGDRLREAIRRLGENTAADSGKLNALEYSDTLLVRSGGRLRSVRVKEIVFIRASGDYTDVLTTRGDSLLLHKTMKEWESRLPRRAFCRIHRSSIVNLEHVDRFEESPRHRYRVYVKNLDEPLEMSRRYAGTLRRKLI